MDDLGRGLRNDGVPPAGKLAEERGLAAAGGTGEDVTPYRLHVTPARLEEVGHNVLVVVVVAEEADSVVFDENQLAVAGVRLVVEELQHVVVILDPPAVAAAHVLDGQV